MPDIIRTETHNEVDYQIRLGVVIPILSSELEGHVLAGKRAGTDDDWQMPQGGLEDENGLAANALREVYQETGIPHSKLAVRLAHNVETFYLLPPEMRNKRVLEGGRTFEGQRHTWVLMTYDGADLPDARLAEDKEFTEFRWVTPQWLIAHARPFQQESYREGFERLRVRGVFGRGQKAA